MATGKPLYLLILLFFTTVASDHTTAKPPEPLPDVLGAAETLSNSGYTSMSLTIQLLLYEPHSPLLFSSTTTSLTIFSPPDSAFISSGQPSLSVLLLHFSPLSLSQQSLQSLPFSSTVPTLSTASTRLYITTSPLKPSEISINDVKVVGSPLFDDGSIVIFAVDDFFNPNFTLPVPIPERNLNPECEKFSVSSWYKEASGMLKSRGYSIIATFLDLQLMGYLGSSSLSRMKFTVFAPLDEVLVGFSGEFPEYKLLFFRHLLPCRLSWTEMYGMKNETLFGGFVEGYGIKITSSGNGEVMVNGVRISAPEIYNDDWIVIHGLQDVIAMPESIDEEEVDEEQLLKVERNVLEANAEWQWAAPRSVEF